MICLFVINGLVLFYSILLNLILKFLFQRFCFVYKKHLHLLPKYDMMILISNQEE